VTYVASGSGAGAGGGAWTPVLFLDDWVTTGVVTFTGLGTGFGGISTSNGYLLWMKVSEIVAVF
jgi:hypothetical protein